MVLVLTTLGSWPGVFEPAEPVLVAAAREGALGPVCIDVARCYAGQAGLPWRLCKQRWLDRRRDSPVATGRPPMVLERPEPCTLAKLLPEAVPSESSVA